MLRNFEPLQLFLQVRAIEVADLYMDQLTTCTTMVLRDRGDVDYKPSLVKLPSRRKKSSSFEGSDKVWAIEKIVDEKLDGRQLLYLARFILPDGRTSDEWTHARNVGTQAVA